MLNTFKTLEFNNILENLSQFALSDNAKAKILDLKPYLQERECKKQLKDTSEAKKIIEVQGSPPIATMTDLEEILELTEKGAMLTPDQLNYVAGFVHGSKRMASYLKKAEHLQISLAYYGMSFVDLGDLQQLIETAIVNDKVDSGASATLKDIRRKIENTRSSIKTKLDTILKSKKAYLSDGNIVIRNGRYALPVKKEYKNQVAGSVIDVSNTGGTVFIEPSAINKIQGEIEYLLIQEDNEIRKILYTLTAFVYDSISQLKTNMKYMETLDFVFAKAKYSISISAEEVPVNTDRIIKIIQGRHPLLNPNECVPLDFVLGESYSGIVVTGPNTGGKTVSLKTVGLLSLMAQCGLHVPAEKGSTLAMNGNILCDIGDGQSISENLSTFSAHITNIVAILKEATEESLVLLDELGSGTDPAEGMGIAVAILEELRKIGCLFLATTHYPEIKDYAKNTKGLINARMEFDRENLKPLYKLHIGEAGESCALSIAERLGFPAHLLKRARIEAYPENKQPKEERFIGGEPMEQSHQKKSSKIIKDKPNVVNKIKDQYGVGDSVIINSDKRNGVVYKTADNMGDLIIQVRGEKIKINHTKISLAVKAEELYPEGYDMSIVFDTVENRKARHKMNKGHNPDLIVTYDEFSK